MDICTSCKLNKHSACLAKLPMVGVKCDCQCPTDDPKSDLEQLMDSLPGYREMFDWVQPGDFDDATITVFEMLMDGVPEELRQLNRLKTIYVLGMYNLSRCLHQPPELRSIKLNSEDPDEDDII